MRCNTDILLSFDFLSTWGFVGLTYCHHRFLSIFPQFFYHHKTIGLLAYLRCPLEINYTRLKEKATYFMQLEMLNLRENKKVEKHNFSQSFSFRIEIFWETIWPLYQIFLLATPFFDTFWKSFGLPSFVEYTPPRFLWRSHLHWKMWEGCQCVMLSVFKQKILDYSRKIFWKTYKELSERSFL